MPSACFQYQLFVADAKYRVPTMQNRFGRFDTTSFQEIILSSGVFRRETASGFYPWGKVEGPRKRVAEGLCGWRHGNSFPMAQNAQSHRQMRSIPHCPKAVFYVFVFHSILNSAIKNNHCPPVFSTEPFYPWSRVERTPASRLAVSSVSVAVSMLVESKRSCALL